MGYNAGLPHLVLPPGYLWCNWPSDPVYGALAGMYSAFTVGNNSVRIGPYNNPDAVWASCWQRYNKLREVSVLQHKMQLGS